MHRRLARLASVLMFAALAATAACNKSEGGRADLPPASGPGAAPLPTLPAFAPSDAGAGATAPDTRTTGTLVARSEVAVAAKASGTIVEIKVDEGSVVKKGDVLFRLDSRDAQLMYKSAQTGVSQAKLHLAAAQREYDRAKSLFDQGAMPRQQWDQVQTALDGAKIGVAAAQNSAAVAQKMIGDATVRAPMAGIVIKKLMEVGSYATMMPPSPVLILQDQSTLELHFTLPERALGAVGTGDARKLTVQIPALGVTRVATVERLSPVVDPRTRTIEVIATIDNSDGSLRPGVMA
ncbi:MAG: efflux RND transporter periplasmic adaptor subunit, partial [Myxococcales bacterium]|nr:efflux RND transporter periplasmic adaptor subunit [Myxococcales bacterium]